ncbi:MAG: rod shape-determining protein MreC [bacterium]|nr:rod shape-determining protein MreC [bacterium]
MANRRSVTRITIALILVGAAIVLTRGHRQLGRGSTWVGALQRPITAATMTVAAWFRAVGRVVRDPGAVRALDAEVATLRAQNAELLHAMAAFQDEQREGAIVYPARLGTPIVARIVAAVLEPTIQELTVEHRAGDIVRVGDPVLATGALIGTVQVSGPSRAVVRLLTDHRTRIGVQLATTPGAIGILEASPGGGVVITHIPSDRALSIGDRIVTSITNAGIVSGIPVGSIAAIRTDPDGFFRTAAIDLTADPARVLAVAILSQDSP